MNPGKRRSSPQRIGTKGEKAFGRWATDRRLSVNKADEDFGIDFFCQTLGPKTITGSEEATGGILAAAVRATEGKRRPRIKLDRVDAENLLRQQHPTALIGVSLDPDRIYFRFVDEGFVDVLSAFLASPQQTLSFAVSRMESGDALFDDGLLRFSRPSSQAKLRMYKLEKNIRASLPGSEVSITQNSTQALATIDVPWIGSAFQYDESKNPEVRILAFDEGKHPAEIPGVILKPELIRVLDHADAAQIRGIVQAEVDLTVQLGSESASATFQVRKLSDETACSHPVGLSFVYSDARRKDGVAAHRVEIRVFRGSQSLGASADVVPFLKLFCPGAELSKDGRPFGHLEDWGDANVRLGPAVTAFIQVSDRIRLDLNDYYLSDLADIELAHSLSFLDAVFNRAAPLERLMRPFILDGAVQLPPDQIPTEAVDVRVPIVLNVKHRGLVLWVKARAAAYLTEDHKWCGLRFERQLELTVEFCDRLVKSAFPEMWINRHWPPIRLEDQKPGVQPFESKEPAYFAFEAEIEPAIED